MNSQILIVGIGGQGVLYATKLLGEAAMTLDLPVIGSETHGMSQRGGS
ncbi:2-oxoacid:acceptor oxidoreductase family protein, partial [bacterium]|nr:2-oxoacid:acceptor oxidoreductase family protein [candidate division CSSED10-310 bacterium]